MATRYLRKIFSIVRLDLIEGSKVLIKIIHSIKLKKELIKRMDEEN